MFMNEYEIDDAAQRFAADPILGPATKTLQNLKDATNANSDGWPYWQKPARAAKALMDLIDTAVLNAWSTKVEITPSQVRKAMTPIKAFRTRSGLDFEIVEVR